MHVLTVPGIGGSGPAHWQTLWEQAYGDRCTRFAPSSWDHPDPADWQRAIAAGLERLGPDTLIVAHSLGCLAVAELASRPTRCRGAVLVAPPDVGGPEFPAQAAAFSGIGTAPMTVPTLVVTSSNDPFCSPRSAARLVATWGAQHVEVGPYRHLNAASGLGGWLLGWYVAHGFAQVAAAGGGVPAP